MAGSEEEVKGERADVEEGLLQPLLGSDDVHGVDEDNRRKHDLVEESTKDAPPASFFDLFFFADKVLDRVVFVYACMSEHCV